MKGHAAFHAACSRGIPKAFKLKLNAIFKFIKLQSTIRTSSDESIHQTLNLLPPTHSSKSAFIQSLRAHFRSGINFPPLERGKKKQFIRLPPYATAENFAIKIAQGVPRRDARERESSSSFCSFIDVQRPRPWLDASSARILPTPPAEDWPNYPSRKGEAAPPRVDELSRRTAAGRGRWVIFAPFGKIVIYFGSLLHKPSLASIIRAVAQLCDAFNSERAS